MYYLDNIKKDSDIYRWTLIIRKFMEKKFMQQWL